MQAIYPYALIVHLFCAIIFVGYLFFDVVIFRLAKRHLDEETVKKMESRIGSRAIKIMPPCVLILALSGGMMASKWINHTEGYLNSLLQQILVFKIILACVIFLAIITNLSCKFIFKRPSPLGNIHPLALSLAVVIIICAKAMFYL